MKTAMIRPVSITCNIPYILIVYKSSEEAAPRKESILSGAVSSFLRDDLYILCIQYFYKYKVCRPL